MEKTWKPTTAGVLSIIAGVVGVIVGVLVILLGGAIAAGLSLVPEIPKAFTLVAVPVIGAIGIPITILGAVAIAGGVCALQRRKWGLALAGSICSLMCFLYLGIPSIIFVVLGKGEFE